MSPVPPADIEAIIRGRHRDPLGVLGMHGGADQPWRIATFQPEAATVAVIAAGSGGCSGGGEVLAELDRLNPEGFFAGIVPGRREAFAYRLRLRAGDHEWEI